MKEVQSAKVQKVTKVGTFQGYFEVLRSKCFLITTDGDLTPSSKTNFCTKIVLRYVMVY